MTKGNVAVGATGLVLGIAALTYASVHSVDILVFPIMINLSLLLFGWFFFRTLRSVRGLVVAQNESTRSILLLKLFFIFTVILVNLIVRQDYLRAKLVSDPLQKVLNLKGMSYEWKRDQFGKENFPEGRHYGVIAQDLEKVLPELVGTRRDGYKGVAYQEIVPILIEAVKEQQKVIDSQRKEITEIKVMLQGMKK